MPCLIHYSEVGQVVILEGENVRRFFPVEGPAEWEALVKALKAEAVADATVERINGASIEDLVAQYQAIRAHEKVKVYDQKGKPKLTLKGLGL